MSAMATKIGGLIRDKSFAHVPKLSEHEEKKHFLISTRVAGEYTSKRGNTKRA